MSPAPRVVVVGAGGIGAPCALALVEAGVAALEAIDDDRVELSNLHRQILFSEADVGRSKIHAFADALEARKPGVSVYRKEGRALPETVFELVRSAAVVVDATDNFATRFLLADACRIARVAVVHAAAVRLVATVMAVAPEGRPCYRCLFEDLPSGPAPDCATAGVLGPVCGVAGALAADLVLRILAGDASAFGSVASYDARADQLRLTAVRTRGGCPLCGDARTIDTLESARYASASCDT